MKKGNMSEKNKVPVRDLRPTKDAKGGRHGHHSHRQLGTRQRSSGHDNTERAGKYWL
jgi:hypothetical protein